jgi:hypothetical protein
MEVTYKFSVDAAYYRSGTTGSGRFCFTCASNLDFLR